LAALGAKGVFGVEFDIYASACRVSLHDRRVQRDVCFTMPMNSIIGALRYTVYIGSGLNRL
jgi:hypothetical protein